MQVQRLRSLGWSDYLHAGISRDRRAMSIRYWMCVMVNLFACHLFNALVGARPLTIHLDHQTPPNLPNFLHTAELSQLPLKLTLTVPRTTQSLPKPVIPK